MQKGLKMKQIKKSDLNLIIAVIALLLTAAAISAAIVYVNRTPEVYPSDREAVYEAKQTRAKEKCFAAYAPAQVINDKSEYTTPYGTFELIESVIDINEYLTLNPTVPDPELCRLYITESGDDETMDIDLSKVRNDIQEIIITVSIHKYKERKQNFGQVERAYVRLYKQGQEAEGQGEFVYDLTEDFSACASVEFCRLYRRNNEWKIQATGIGHHGGLEELVEKYT
mgnify:CR=1 FL=1